MIGIKDQCFGVEIELTGITRAEAAEALAAYLKQRRSVAMIIMIAGMYRIGRASSGAS